MPVALVHKLVLQQPVLPKCSAGPRLINKKRKSAYVYGW